MRVCRQLVLGKGESHLTDKETEDQAAEWLALVTPSLRGQASSSPTYLFQSWPVTGRRSNRLSSFHSPTELTLAILALHDGTTCWGFPLGG